MVIAAREPGDLPSGFRRRWQACDPSRGRGRDGRLVPAGSITPHGRPAGPSGRGETTPPNNSGGGRRGRTIEPRLGAGRRGKTASCSNFRE